MANSERPSLNVSPPPAEYDQSAVLFEVDRQLEAADEIENPVDRFFQREKLLELRDELRDEMDEASGDGGETA